ncbi:MAG: spheroidene monooxygenase [Pararhodobacter sp.]|nr:spheroidene monooxygenase [Pararhodobacter sp.]
MQTVTLSLFRFQGLSRLWVLGQMAAARPGLTQLPGLQFFKLCGSGTGEGFTPRPNWAVWAILGVWRDPQAARAGLDGPGAFRRWRAHATEATTFHLQPLSVRGHWSGHQPFAEPPSPVTPPGLPLAALTRATIRPARALRFWQRVPDISARIGDDPNVRFKIGIGEVPLLHQVTFSIWPDAASMAAFARTGPHADAIRAVRTQGWFTEELYARFAVRGIEGTWHGAHPLAQTTTKEAA